MYQIDFHKPLHIHFIGIGGISMSGLAEILLGEDFKVSGSDSKESPLTDSLTRKGARIFYGQRASNITDDVELVVYTAAIHPDNPEYASAVEKGIPMLTRAQLLGQIMRNYDTPIAVSGTHGKTTTTSMISQILLEADADPTISVGGILPSIGGNIRVGQSETFVTEACEYTNSFLSFFPKISVILNIDADHLDFFKDIDDIRHSFRRFAQLLPADGALIINADTPHYQDIIKDLSCKIITYGLEHEAQYQATDITYDKYGHASFTVLKDGRKAGSFYLKVPGMYLDSKTRTKVEETGGANFLFVTKDGKVVTPKSDSILPSITRRSLIYVAKEYLGLEAEEREVYFDEVKDFAECGLCGTAAVISPVGKIVDHGKEICFPSGMNEMGPITKKLYETLTGIQMGRIQAPEGWLKVIE